MKVSKKYIAIKVETDIDHMNNSWRPYFSFEEVKYDFGRRVSPDILYDTEEEAIKHAFKADKYGKWLILPIITFEE